MKVIIIKEENIMKNYEEFKDFEEIIDPQYPRIKCYKNNDSIMFIEPNFYTQLVFLKDYYRDNFDKIFNKIIEIALKNKKAIFTADFENPVVYKDGFIYREINDILAELKLSFDNKSNPDSDWKD